MAFFSYFRNIILMIFYLLNAIFLGLKAMVTLIIMLPVTMKKRFYNVSTRTLIEAIHTQNLELVQEHLKFGIDVNKCDDEGFFPLHVALLPPSNLEIIKVLLKNNANVKWRDCFGANMLQRALLYGFLEAVEIILFHMSFLENWPDSVKYEIISDITGFLVKRVNDYNLEKTNFPTVLQFMILRNEEVASGLLDEDIPFELNAVNFDYGDNVTLINVAVRYGSTEIVQKLIESGADVNKTYASVKTPLQLAIQRGDQEMIRLIVKHTTQNSENKSLLNAFSN